MDVTKIISKLRSEREDIEKSIRSLEYDNMNLGARTHRNGHPMRGRLSRFTRRATETTAQSVIEIRRNGEPHDGS
jgi:hypothetical protein